MKKLKTQKGITLVALIITIVVLLILAAVAIGTVRDSNIIGHAQNAAVGYNQAKNNEVDALAKYEEKIDEVLSKDLVYVYEGDNYKVYITLKKDNQIILENLEGKTVGTYKYVEVTPEDMEENGIDPEDYSLTVVKYNLYGNDDMVLLSKNKNILYYDGVEFILEGYETTE